MRNEFSRLEKDEKRNPQKYRNKRINNAELGTI